MSVRDLSGDVLVTLIMVPHFDVQWIFTCGRLVCSDWNEYILSSPLSIKINLGLLNKERIDQFMESGVRGIFKRLDRIAIIGLDIDAMHLSLFPKPWKKQNENTFLSQWWNYGVEVVKSLHLTKLSFEHVHLLSIFDGLSGLEVNGVGDLGIEYLMKHEKLTNLNGIVLSADKTKITQRISKLGISKLTCIQFDNLKILDLRRNVLGVEGVKQLFECKKFPQLTWLSLEGCHNFENRLDEGFKNISDSNMSLLTYLNLSDCKISDDAIGYLFSKKWAPLKEVHLNNNFIGQKGCKYISSSPIETIDHLELSRQKKGIDEFSCIELANLPFRLKYLTLESNPIGKGIEYLCNGNLEYIETLILSCCSLPSTACEHIASSVFKSSLTSLNISDNSFLKLKGLFLGTLTNLKSLSASKIGYIHDIPILKSDSLPSIRSIDLGFNPIKREFLVWMSESFQSLDFLGLRSTSMTDTEVILLKKMNIKKADLSCNRFELFDYSKWGYVKANHTITPYW